MADEFESLRTVSSRMGSNILLIQGGGGNASLKHNGDLIVKSSGTWMSDALESDIFVTLDLGRVRDLIDDGVEDYSSAASVGIASHKRPSIETALHAIMPHQVVIHAHAVNAITTTLLPDRAERLKRALWDLNWNLVDYVQPGASLARAVSLVLDAETPDVLLLANHGLVVGADFALEAESRMHEVEQRLALLAADLPDFPFPEEAPPISGYRWAHVPAAHALAHHRDIAAALLAGALVPDQVVYLGGPAVWLSEASDFVVVEEGWRKLRGVKPGLIFLEGVGALIRDDVTSGGLSMIQLLVEVARRVPCGTVPSTLSLAQEQDLLGWESEAYRLAVDSSRAPK